MESPSTTLLLTPGMLGRDGISCLTRQIAAAVSPRPLDIWSLQDEPGSQDADGAEAPQRLRGAARGRARFVSWAFRESLSSQKGRRVIVLHTQLAPVALPLAWRGADLLRFLVGIEVWRPLTGLQSRALRWPGTLVAISEFSARCFKESNPSFADETVVVCHPGLAKLSVASSEPPTSPAFSLFAHGDYALIVGRMASTERYKGHDALLELWPRLLRRVPSASLLVAGHGDDRSRLEHKSRELGLSERVRFTGEVPDTELEALYRGCRFFVMPSRNEGFGLVFLEAMRAGKACIGAAGAASEIIVDGETGFVVRPGDGEQLLESLTRLFRESGRRRVMGERGRERFLEHFTLESFRERFLRLLA